MEINQTLIINNHQYNLTAEISSSHAGYSDIWKATDEQGQTVILKTVKLAEFSEQQEQTKQEYLKHFDREIEFYKKLSNKPCHFIIAMLDYGKLNGLPVLILPFIPFNLANYIQQAKQINLTRHLDWCLQIAKGLLAIHEMGFHYRDLKLTNILIDTQGVALKLADFGTVKTNTNKELHTYSGTPSRMAPEQMLPSSRDLNSKREYDYFYDTDHRTDFFSLGLIFFELITGIKQLTSQHDIQSLRERQGAQAAWEKRNQLGGINQHEIALFKKKLTQLVKGDDDATFMKHGQTPEQPACVQPLTDLISSLLARNKNDRPEQAHYIIDTLTNIVTPLANDTAIYALTALQQSAVNSTDIKATRNNFRYYYVGAAVIAIALAGTFAYPFIKPYITSPPLKQAIELPLDDTEIPLASNGIPMATGLIDSSHKKTATIINQGSPTEKPENQDQPIKEAQTKRPLDKIISPAESSLIPINLTNNAIEKSSTLTTNKPNKVMIHPKDKTLQQKKIKLASLPLNTSMTNVEKKSPVIVSAENTNNKQPHANLNVAVDTLEDKKNQLLPPTKIKTNNETVELVTNKLAIPQATNSSPENSTIKKQAVSNKNSVHQIHTQSPKKAALLHQNDETIVTPKLPASLPFQDMVIITADQFIMGNNKGFVDERPEREVNIPSFAVSKKLITEQQYMEFCKHTKLPCAASGKNSDNPITEINKNQALAYISYQSSQTNASLRLLSEAEWEYLAIQKTKSINFNGIEWLADCAHLNYRQAPIDGSAWLSQNSEECQMSSVRGNKLKQPLTTLTARNRFPLPINLKKNNLGFRIAVSLPTGNNNEQ